MRALRLLWNRYRTLLCALGLHRWQGLWGPGRPHGRGSGRYGWVVVCLWCSREK